MALRNKKFEIILDTTGSYDFEVFPFDPLHQGWNIETFSMADAQKYVFGEDSSEYGVLIFDYPGMCEKFGKDFHNGTNGTWFRITVYDEKDDEIYRTSIGVDFFDFFYDAKRDKDLTAIIDDQNKKFPQDKFAPGYYIIKQDTLDNFSVAFDFEARSFDPNKIRIVPIRGYVGLLEQPAWADADCMTYDKQYLEPKVLDGVIHTPKSLFLYEKKKDGSWYKVRKLGNVPKVLKW